MGETGMERLEFFDSVLMHAVAVATFCLESISVACVIAGLFKTLQLAWELNRRRHGRPFPFNSIRIRFGTWLSLALEFQLGSDIVATTVAPSLAELGKLALIAVIRTFLNYFLAKELEAELAIEKERAELLTAKESDNS
jgi:uncharacterized membrane protein